MKKQFVLCTVGFCCLFAIVYIQAEQSRAASMGLMTHRLSDRESTVYNTTPTLIQAGPFGAHVTWGEYVSVGSSWDTDLFYAHLPNQSATRLTATTGLLGAYQLAVGSNNHAYIVWSEEAVTSPGDDVFFWKTGMVIPARLSDTTMINDDAAHLYLVVDEENEAHVFWSEIISTTQGTAVNIFYWSENGGLTQFVEGIPGLFSPDAVRVLGVAAQNDTIHVLWRDLGSELAPFYWNSQTETAVNLMPGLSGGDAYVWGYFLNEAGVFHILWGNEAPGGAAYDYRHWNSVGATNHPVSNSTELQSVRLLQDGNGNAHVVWAESGVTHHWDSVNQVDQVIPQSANAWLEANGQVGDHIHLVWSNNDTNWPGHLNDVFYWRSDMAEPVNVTEHSQAPADVATLKLMVDETDTAHVLWREGDSHFYYNQADGQTQVVTGALNLASSPIVNPIIPGVAEFGSIFIARNGTAYALFASTENNTTAPYFLWQSATNSVVPITSVYSDTTPSLSRMLWLDSNGDPHAAWEDNSLDGEGTNLHYWDNESGSQDLTDSPETDFDIEGKGALAVADSTGNVYIIWQEYGVLPEKNEVYAAYSLTTFTNFAYLPVIMAGD